LHLLSGLDLLLRKPPQLLRNKKVGLITNHTSVTRDLRHIVDALYQHPDVDLAALYGPEHGIRGDNYSKSHIDQRTGLPVYSLYGRTLKPTKEMLHNIDALIFDIQDVGARFYTYIWTMSYGLEAAAQAGIPFIILDRPNPINGVSVEGNILDRRFESFVGRYSIPIRHGMTVGELAMLFNSEYKIDADLEVAKMESWHREMWFDETGLIWVIPSPNMPTLDTATVYTGTCLFEGTNVSEGRGTTKPFELIGAPWIDEMKLASELNSRKLSGVIFREASFTPSYVKEKYQEQICHGVQVHVVDREIFKPVETGLHMVEAIRRLYPDQFQWRQPQSERTQLLFDRLMGTDKVRLELDRDMTVSEIIGGWQEELSAFMEIRKEYLLYPARR